MDINLNVNLLAGKTLRSKKNIMTDGETPQEESEKERLNASSVIKNIVMYIGYDGVTEKEDVKMGEIARKNKPELTSGLI